jgi:signal transduction histidine kinase
VSGLRSIQPELETVLAAALAGQSGVQFLTENGVQTVVAYAPLHGTPWAILIRRPVADLIAPFFRYEQVLPLILAAAAFVSFLTLYFGLSLVVRPVHALIDCAARIGQGNFWAAAQSVGGVQELEELRQALHAMAQLLQSERAALQDYLREVTNAQEEERARLARELHDETVQTLIALDHKAQQVQRGLDKHPERTHEQVAELRKITVHATQEVRRLSYGLRPLALDEIGLDSALERLAQEGHVSYRCQGELRRLVAEKELAFFRIAQESLANTRRHARAQHVRMSLVFGPTTVTLGIGDDGVGFDLPAKLSDFTRSGHFGLMGITERAQLIGGQLFCESTPGRGVTIIVQAPFDGFTIAADEEIVAATRDWLAATN